jgi:hypothetical protein
MKKKRVAEFAPERVRDVSEAVYRDRLSPEALKLMIEKDADQGEKLRGRAASYDSLTRSYMRALQSSS